MPKKPPRKPIKTRKQKIADANSVEFSHGVNSSTANVVAEEYLENPVQPEIDKNRYRVIKLRNGLTALLVSIENRLLQDEAQTNNNFNYEKDIPPEADDIWKEKFAEIWEQIAKESRKSLAFASCTLCLNVGSFSDPPDISGIALILSRAILCSSTKYPQVESFANFLTKHDGLLLRSSQHCDSTYFSFALLARDLPAGLDRFTNCFANPILRRDSIIAERDDLKPKYQGNLSEINVHTQEDLLFNALSAGIKRHAGYAERRNDRSKLFCITKDALLAEVNKFMKRHYSANRMTVVIEAHLPLDTLEEYTRKYFTRIPNNGLPPVDLSSHSYKRFFKMSAFNMFYEMHPILIDLNEIEFNWPIPPVRDLYRSKAHLYIKRLIENEEEGSLIHFLRKQNWCSLIKCFVGAADHKSNAIYSLLAIALRLTPDGLRYQKKIIDVVYSYVNFLKIAGPNKRIYDEVRRTAEGVFRTSVKYSTKDGNPELCKNMQLYPSVDYLGANVLCYEYDPEMIKTCLDCMSPERANISLYGQNMPELHWLTSIPDSEDDDEDLGEFKRFKIPREWINEWMSIAPLACFRFPQPNSFCPDDFSLLPPVKNGPKYPVKIHSDTLCEVWHKAGDNFRTPESRIVVTLNSDIPLQSAETAAMFDLFCKAVIQLSREQLFPAIAAGMQYKIERDETSFSVSASGFNTKLQLLLRVIGDFVGRCSSLLSKEFFISITNEQLGDYIGLCTDNESLATDVRNAILFPVYWTTADKIAVLSGIQFEKYRYFAASWTSRVYVKSLVQGNIRESDALEMVKSFVGLSKCGSIAPENRPRLERKEIPRGSSRCKIRSLCPHPTPDYAMSNYQFGEKSLTTGAAIDLLVMILLAPSGQFSQLNRRCEEERLSAQTLESSCNEYSLRSKRHSPSQFMAPECCLETARRHLFDAIHGFSNLLLLFIKHTFIDLKRAAFARLKEEMAHNWSEVKTGECMFDRYTREAEAIERLDLQQLRTILIGLVTDNPSSRKLTIQVVGRAGRMKCDEERCENYCTNIQFFRMHVQDMKIEILSDPSGHGNEEGHHYIRDIPSYKRPLKTICAKATDFGDKMAADFEESCKL